jgi:hypothetical protein
MSTTNRRRERRRQGFGAKGEGQGLMVERRTPKELQPQIDIPCLMTHCDEQEGPYEGTNVSRKARLIDAAEARKESLDNFGDLESEVRW